MCIGEQLQPVCAAWKNKMELALASRQLQHNDSCCNIHHIQKGRILVFGILVSGISYDIRGVYTSVTFTPGSRPRPITGFGFVMSARKAYMYCL